MPCAVTATSCLRMCIDNIPNLLLIPFQFSFFSKLSCVLFENTRGVDRVEKSTFATRLCRNKNSSHVRGPEWCGLRSLEEQVAVKWAVFGFHGYMALEFFIQPNKLDNVRFMMWY